MAKTYSKFNFFQNETYVDFYNFGFMGIFFGFPKLLTVDRIIRKNFTVEVEI